MTRGSPAPETVTLHVPFRIVKRGGRKEMHLPPEGSGPHARFDNTMIKAMARAFRWQRMLDAGEFATIADLAEHERIAAPYLTRLLRLTQLSPEIVEAILEGRQPPDLTLESLRAPFPMDWSSQRALLWL
ncbi:hypothetical protein K1T73_06705 [Roseovarius sp. SCSIO 43702]|uniref:hypothetical protein n=1 Tax=Roseovarius sp. SCSIO 43702 TaxID=2823043 RepID=UPI001C736548|nr:hypothetical protein [Roseovarius sp. SCSIO 43702]QYX58056.1 hypothetical protein K1T73_06705 [Roseovarius sp. SCSIO 43702]